MKCCFHFFSSLCMPFFLTSVCFLHFISFVVHFETFYSLFPLRQLLMLTNAFIFFFHIVWTWTLAGSIQIKLNYISCYFSTSNWRILLFSSNMYLSVHMFSLKVQFNEHIPIITYKITKLMFLHQVLMKHTPKILPLIVLLNWW